MAANPPTPMGVMAASVPPAIITSASPYLMTRAASPMECALVVQAVQVASFGPLALLRMLTCPAARFTMAAGIKNGEILRGPPFSRLECSRSMTSKPPMPEPMLTPVRSATFFILHLEVGHAQCLIAGGDGQMNKARHLARLFFLDELQWIEVLYLGRNLAGELRSVKRGNALHAALARQQRRPHLGGVVARRRKSIQFRLPPRDGSNYFDPFAWALM